MTQPSAGKMSTELHELIGKFIAAFSRLHGILEYVALLLICRDGPIELYERASISIAGLTTQPLSNIVFSLITQSRGESWSPEDKALVKQCRKEIDLLIAERNRVAHDVWASIPQEEPNEAGPPWIRSRRLASPLKGQLLSAAEINASYLSDQSIHVDRLMYAVQILAITAIGDLRVPLSATLEIRSTAQGEKIYTRVSG